MFGAHHQHVAAVAVGDDLLLQVLRRVALAEERLERAAQPASLRAQPVADRTERRAGIVGDVTGGVDLAADVGDLGGTTRPVRRCARAEESCRPRSDGTATLLDRFQVVGQRQQAQRFERAAVDRQRARMVVEVGRGAQREARVNGQEADALARGPLSRDHGRRRGQRGRWLPAPGDPGGVTARASRTETMRSNSRARSAPE